MEKFQYGQKVEYQVVDVLHDFRTSKSHVQYVKTLNHGTMLLMDDEIQYSTLDEHRYHYLLIQPLFQQSNNILILGGGDGLAARNLYKSPNTTSITIVDWDSDFVEFAKTKLPENCGSLLNPKTQYVCADALKYIQVAGIKYDGVIIDLPDPDGEFMEALYTNILTDLPRILHQNSTVSMHIGPVSLCEDHPCWAFIAKCKRLFRQSFGILPEFDKIYVPSFSHEWGFLSCYNGTHSPYPRYSIETDINDIYSKI
jgi:predicted membrane-bound spermidine synthase